VRPREARRDPRGPRLRGRHLRRGRVRREVRRRRVLRHAWTACALDARGPALDQLVGRAPAPLTLFGKIARNTSLLTSGRFFITLSGLVGTAAITRYLGTGAFGSLAAGLAFVSIALNLGDVGLFTVATREVARNPSD